jgi:recombination protein RecA
MNKKKEKVEKTKGDSLSKTIADIRKKFGEDSIMMLNEKPHSDVKAISTGSIGLDHAIGIGGMPRGRIVEVYGAESSGKTTLALHIIAEAQKSGDICAFVDAEHALDPEYAKKIGVQTDKLLISQPNGGEEALNIVESLVTFVTVTPLMLVTPLATSPKSQ